jgi:subtilisin family serine protease
LVTRFEVMLCPGAQVQPQDLLLLQQNHTRRRRFLESRKFWRQQRSLVHLDECADIIQALEQDDNTNTDTITTSTLAWTLPTKLLQGNDETFLRDCLQALIVQWSLHPQVCWIGGYQNIELLNVVASGIVQSSRDHSTFPFYSVGLDGTDQVVAVSDTGLDTDNCYMWDNTTEVPRDDSGHFNSNARKVIQYYAHLDAKDLYNGHGTHVAGSIAGRRATDGLHESNGTADGIAKAAKLAMFDIGTDRGLRLPSTYTLLKPGYNAGARIHSASWGTPRQNGYTALDAGIDSFM